MRTVTADLRTARDTVSVSPAFVRWAKAHAHRSHRRAWRTYLRQVTNGTPLDDARETDLDRPRLTAWDIS